MKMIKVYFSILALLALSVAGTAQDVSGDIEPCGQVRAHEDLFEEHPEAAPDQNPAWQELEDWTTYYKENLATQRGGGPYIIPVVFHVIHVNGPENISRAQIEDAIRVLNEDFNALNADLSAVVSPFDTIVGNVGVEFRLATKDPMGNCHSGINRIYSSETYNGDGGMKDLIIWPRAKYLNIWTCINAAGAAGYTMQPGSVSGWWGEDIDGIVVNHDYVGAIGTGSYTRSHTLTHEVGHWINLDHTWGGSNDPGLASNCSTDDGISDTPNTKGNTSCSLSANSCTNSTVDNAYWGVEVIDNVQNYMEYSYCSRMFTQEQAVTMIAALNSGTADRNDLWQPSNLAATGVTSPGVLCAADFYSTITTICEGDSIQLIDDSYHGVTQWDWTLTGATPNTSTDQNPWVTYNTAGLYDITLTAGDGASVVGNTKTDYVLVLPLVGNSAPFSESFESPDAWPTTGWYNYNPGSDHGWVKTTSTAASGNQSLKLDNRLGEPGEVDEFLSETYDLQYVSEARISFHYAFKQKNSSNTDRLQVLVSNNCGQTWSVRKTLQNSGLSTSTGYTSGNWTPGFGTSDWSYEEVTSIPASYLTSNFRFKFVMTNGGGNNIFIDNINVEVITLGVEEQENQFGLNVYPNPLEGNSVIDFTLTNSEQVNLTVVDLVGKEIMTLMDETATNGQHQVAIPANELASGIYFVNLQVGEQVVTQKIVVQ